MSILKTKKKNLDRLDDDALRARVAAAEATVAEIEARPFAQVRGTEAETLEKLSRALTTIEAGRAELASRHHQAVVESAPVRRAFRDHEDDREERERRLLPVARALGFVQARAHRELQGSSLAADRLSGAEGEELVELVAKAKAIVYDENAEPLTERETARYERLVGKAAGDEDIFERARKRAEAKARIGEIADKRKLDSLPPRPLYAPPGSVSLPRFAVHTWLVNDRDGSWTVADLGALVVILSVFENRDAGLIANARLEEEGGDVVLVIAGGIGSTDLRFRGAIGGSSLAGPDDSGFVRLRAALATLARNGWVELEWSVSEARVKLGPRAKKLHETPA